MWCASGNIWGYTIRPGVHDETDETQRSRSFLLGGAVGGLSNSSSRRNGWLGRAEVAEDADGIFEAEGRGLIFPPAPADEGCGDGA